MPQQRLLLLNANRLSAWRWQGGKLDAEREFSVDTSGQEAFAEYVAGKSSSVFSMLVDLAEEGFQIEDVPYVGGRDRSALTKRRLAQYFYGTPFTLATTLGREKGGRRDEKVLFAALTQPRLLEPWLAIMQTAQAQLAGIWSVPLALASLLATPRSSGGRLILTISRAGVRQTFLRDGKLHFSRLTTLATGTLEEAAVACAVEAQKMYQYLTGQRLINRTGTLDVSILAHPAQLTVIRGHCRPSTELAFDFIDLLAEARKARLKTLPQDSDCSPLLLHQLVRRPPPQQFAPAAERRQYRLGQLRSGLVAAAVVIFASCLIYAGKLHFDSQALLRDAGELKQATLGDERKYDSVMKSLPPLPIGTDDMRELVTRFEALAQRSPPLETTLQPLSRALDATPGIDVQRIAWELSTQIPVVKEQASSVFRQPPLAVGGSYYAITDVDAQLPVAMVNDHRAMLDLIDRFLAELGKEKTLGVQVTQLPFDVESGKTIKSTDDAAPGRAEPPKFSFRLVQGF